MYAWSFTEGFCGSIVFLFVSSNISLSTLKDLLMIFSCSEQFFFFFAVAVVFFFSVAVTLNF